MLLKSNQMPDPVCERTLLAKLPVE